MDEIVRVKDEDKSYINGDHYFDKNHNYFYKFHDDTNNNSNSNNKATTIIWPHA